MTPDRLGNANGAYYFNGKSAYIRIKDDTLLDLNNDFSISTWFKMDAYASKYNASMLISKHDGDIGSDGFIYGILNADHNNNQFLIYNANGIWGARPDTLTYVQTGIWYNFIVTFNKTSHILNYFLNGILVSSQASNIEMLDNDLDLSIGYSTSTYKTHLDYFTGSIDDVRMYNRVLTNKEIRNLSLN